MALLIAHIEPAAIGVADEARSIDDENQTLSVIENLAGEVTLSLQLRLESSDSADVENQAAVLNNPAEGVAHREAIDQHVNRRAIFAVKSFLVIFNSAVLLHFLRKCLVALFGEVDTIANIGLQQFFAAAITKHMHQCVIDFHKTPVWCGKEQSFLNIAE